MFAALHVYKIQDSPFVANNQYDKYDKNWILAYTDLMIYLVLSYIAIKISIGSHIVLKHFSLAKPWGNANQTWDH